jgi:hypothetical protein
MKGMTLNRQITRADNCYLQYPQDNVAISVNPPTQPKFPAVGGFFFRNR